MSQAHRYKSVVSLVIFCALSFAQAAPSQTKQVADSTVASAKADPVSVVRSAVKNELDSLAAETRFWRYRLSKETNSGLLLRELIETREGIVARTLAFNGHPLTAEERTQDDERLAKLINDPEEQKKKLQQQRDEQNRIFSLVRALPDALLYQFDGAETIDGRQTVRLKFHPNPSFNPGPRETYVYKGTDGHLWIDAAATRLVKMDAVLVENVSLGWGGILGRINKGGHIVLQQSMVGNGNWKISTLILEATGRLFFFKSISLKQRQFGTGYRPVPPKLTIAQAVELLKSK